MSNENMILGKDVSLESTINTMQHRLQELGFHVEEFAWLNPVEGTWSVQIRDRDCPLLSVSGKGATRLACMASALGEFFERLATNYFWSPYYLGPEIAKRAYVHFAQERWFIPGRNDAWPEGILNERLQAFYNPMGSISATTLVDINSGNVRRGICALPFVRLRDDAVTYFPVNIISNLYLNNGMASGNTVLEARTQAMAEIFERHVKARVMGEGICLPDVPAHVMVRYPRIAAGINALRAAGLGILVKDASLGGRHPVMNVTLLNPQDQGCFASFGAHPRMEVALERAFTQLLQGRALENLVGFPEPSFELEDAASATNLEAHFAGSSGVVHWKFLGATPDYAFCDWNFANSTEADCAWCVSRLHQDGHEVYVADYLHLGVYVCRVLVPGLSEICPLEDLEYENNSVGNALRHPLLNLKHLDDQECADLMVLLNESGLADQRLVAGIIGVTPNTGSFWSELRVGELKTLLALALGDEAATLEGCEWVKHFDLISPQRRKVYACIESLINLAEMGESGPYLASLRQLYGAGAVAQARALIMQTDRFMGLSSPGLELLECANHHRLLDAYDKVHRSVAKALT